MKYVIIRDTSLEGLQDKINELIEDRKLIYKAHLVGDPFTVLREKREIQNYGVTRYEYWYCQAAWLKDDES